MPRFRNILCIITPEEHCRPVVERAVALAERDGATLSCVVVIPRLRFAAAPEVPALVREEHLLELQAEARERLASFLEPWAGRCAMAIDVLVGKLFLETIRAVLRRDIDLVIKPAAPSGMIQRLLGSDDMHLLRKCPCPLWLIGPDAGSRCQRIVAAVDFDLDGIGSREQALNDDILDLAGALALADGAELHVVHAWDAPGELSLLSWSNNPVVDTARFSESERARHQAAMDRLSEAFPRDRGAGGSRVAVQFHLLKGAASEVIPATVRELQADLVVMGTLARTGIPGLFIGNTAETILGHLHCSVLAIKPPGFETPVKPD